MRQILIIQSLITLNEIDSYMDKLKGWIKGGNAIKFRFLA